MRLHTVALTTVAMIALAGCFGGSMGDYGVTPGGSQDINHARDLIENGLIPSAADYTVESPGWVMFLAHILAEYHIAATNHAESAFRKRAAQEVESREDRQH